MALNDRNLKAIFKLRRPIAQTSPVFPPLSEVEALAVVVLGIAGKAAWDGGFPASSTTGASGAVPRASPFGPAEMVAHNRGENGGSNPPFYPSWCGTEQG